MKPLTRPASRTPHPDLTATGGVGARASVTPVSTRASVQRIPAVSPTARRGLRRRTAGRGPGRRRAISAVTAAEDVVAASAAEHVVSTLSVDDVVAGGPVEGLAVVGALDLTGKPLQVPVAAAVAAAVVAVVAVAAVAVPEHHIARPGLTLGVGAGGPDEEVREPIAVDIPRTAHRVARAVTGLVAVQPKAVRANESERDRGSPGRPSGRCPARRPHSSPRSRRRWGRRGRPR